MTTVTTTPSFAEQVLAVDVPALARRIQQQGSRAAIQASTVEIVAMAVQINDLTPVVASTFDLLVSANQLHDERDQHKRRMLRDLVLRQIDDIASALIALGYDKPTTTEEKTNG